MTQTFIDMMPYAFWGIVFHLIVDWLLQSEWMAINKVNWEHPAALLHASLHFCFMLIVFNWNIALGIAALHLLIDTRTFMNWFREFMGQTTKGEMGVHVAIWTDQVAHITVIGIASFFQVILNVLLRA